MPRLLASTELLVNADHRMFGICDDGPDGPFSAPTPGHDWLSVGTYEVAVGAAQDGVRVGLRLEVWDGRPEDEGAGDETVRVSFPSGRVSINEITAGIRPAVFTLPAPGTYNIELSTTGGPETAQAYFALFDQYDADDDAFEDAERALDGQELFTARFWPVAGT